MPCKYLSCYTPVNNTWSVAGCSFNGTPYVPSMHELESYCKTGRREQCPVFSQSLPPLHDKCFWPALDGVTLARCR
jgi:hypothetical protein